MYSPYCLTQVNCLLFILSFLALVYGDGDAALFALLASLHFPRVLLVGASFLRLAVKLHLNSADASPVVGARSRRVKLSRAFPPHMVSEGKWRGSQNVFHIEKEKKAEGGEPGTHGTRTGDLRLSEL